MATMIINVCTKTLRRWEKRGLITPKRTLGGHRRYSMDYDRSKCVKKLRYNSDKSVPIS
ncbi:MAG: MerR family DNA-binding transcriptional regulator [Promethearchaeota archaeon]